MRRRRHKHDLLFFLAGWLFADLFVVLTVIFVASTAISPTIAMKSTPTPTPAQPLTLRREPIDLTIQADIQNLLSNDPTAITQVKQQVSDQLYQQKAAQLRAGITLIFGGGPDSNQDVSIAKAMESILISLGQSQHLVFNQQTVFKDFIDLADPLGTITLNVYVFDS